MYTRYRSERYVEDNPATSHREDVARSEAIPSNGKRVLSGSGQYEAPGLEPSRVASIKLSIYKYMLHLYTNILNINIYIYIGAYISYKRMNLIYIYIYIILNIS